MLAHGEGGGTFEGIVRNLEGKSLSLMHWLVPSCVVRLMQKTARVVAAGANSAPYGRVHLTNILEVAIVLLVINGLRSDTMLGDDSGVKRHEAMGQVSGKRAAARVSDAKCAAVRRTAATPASPSVSVEVTMVRQGDPALKAAMAGVIQDVVAEGKGALRRNSPKDALGPKTESTDK
ncbi:hypothetical protein BHM03_00000448 [Ensete ventricosum]|uniref:Uncharacterized protein n=1 Tax=Ensete ventricosum TaxID=4639 RepID=A0A445M8J7_ENSVE|nr:hypothetical protein BHM03_00000448 [Ensete ventricosum]